jgi:hypothetical protein
MVSNQQISIMCDIAALGGAGLPADRHQHLVELVAAGYIERHEGTPGLFRLTPKGQRVLDERGVGANEA